MAFYVEVKIDVREGEYIPRLMYFQVAISAANENPKSTSEAWSFSCPCSIPAFTVLYNVENAAAGINPLHPLQGEISLLCFRSVLTVCLVFLFSGTVLPGGRV